MAAASLYRNTRRRPRYWLPACGVGSDDQLDAEPLKDVDRTVAAAAAAAASCADVGA